MPGEPRRPEGAMRREYGDARQTNAALIFRYRTRAAAAVRGYRSVWPGGRPVSVLELGSADGRTLLEIRRLVGTDAFYCGVELSPELQGLSPDDIPGVEFHVGDVLELPAPVRSHQYDLVTALALLEHVEDPLGCLREAYSVMNDGAVLVASCPNPTWDRLASRFGLVREEHHVQELDETGLMSVMAEAGFHNITFRPFMWMPVGALPILGVPIDPEVGLDIDARVRALGRWTGPMFVNQLVTGVR